MEIDVLEYQVLSILRDRLQFLKYAHLFREEIFESHQTRTIYRIISDFHSKGKSETLPIRSLKILLTSKIKPEDRGKFRGIVRRVRRNSVTDVVLIEPIVRRFAKRQLLKQAIMEGLNSLDSGEEADLERVKQRIDEAIGVDTKDIDISYDYFRDLRKRIRDEAYETRIATKISEDLDDALSGGLAPGEIGIVVAPTGVGKTFMLVNVGYGAMIQGKKVVHATLEIKPRKVARRYDLRISSASFADIRNDPGLVQRKLNTLRIAGAGLHIKDYTAALCSVQDLRAYLERLRTTFRFDIVIVDHVDLMYTPKAYKERRFELSSIVAGLRRLAAEFDIPVWTASQATRKAGEHGRTRLWDIAEDIGKANWADLAITISQTEGEKEEGVAWLRIAKSRLGAGNPKVQVSMDYETWTMEGIKKKALGTMRRRLRG